MPYDKTKPYSCPCCGYWNGDMKYDYYKHKEPLIKNEKMRKVVRTWAELHGDTEFDVDGGCQLTTFRGLSSMLEIDFRCSWTRDGVYSIEELCGEEEE